MVEKAIRASKEMEKRGVGVEVVDLRTIVPLDTETIFNSVKKTGKVIVFHEDSKFMGFGAEIASLISENCFEYLDAPVKGLQVLMSTCRSILYLKKKHCLRTPGYLKHAKKWQLIRENC